MKHVFALGAALLLLAPALFAQKTFKKAFTGSSPKVSIVLEKAEIETEQYKKQSQLELSKTNRQLLDAENKVNLSKLAFEQSQEAFRIRQNRFTQGLEKTTDLLMAETQMAQKELEHLQAVFEYNFTKQYLQFLTK